MIVTGGIPKYSCTYMYSSPSCLVQAQINYIYPMANKVTMICRATAQVYKKHRSAPCSYQWEVTTNCLGKVSGIFEYMLHCSNKLRRTFKVEVSTRPSPLLL